MKKYDRSWFNYSRDHECLWLGQWFSRSIGTSWLDDNRGILKKDKWFKTWQRSHHDSEGNWAGSESRRQFTWKLVCYLSSRGILVARKAWQTAKKVWESKKPTPATRVNIPKEKDIDPPQKGKNPFDDPEFRKRKGLKPLPPWKVRKS